MDSNISSLPKRKILNLNGNVEEAEVQKNTVYLVFEMKGKIFCDSETESYLQMLRCSSTFKPVTYNHCSDCAA